MSHKHNAVVEHVLRLATEMPLAMAETLAEAIGRADASSWVSARTDILQCVSQPHYRALASEFLDVLQRTAPDLSPQAVSLALHTAAASEQASHERQSVELVWTGPETQVVPLRQTEQVMLQVIELARERLLLVSYAVYRIPRVCEALARAAVRGVNLRVVIEGAQRHDGLDVYDRLRALGDEVARRATVYLWPLDRRPRDEMGGVGVLHVKCAVADGRWLYLSSANLTENAFTLNMELGVLIRDEGVAGQVEAHFDRLIEMELLAKT